MQSKQLAIGGVFAAVAASVVGLAIAFGGNAQQEQPIQPAGDVVHVQVTSTTASTPASEVAAVEVAPPTTTAVQAAPVQPKPAPKGQTGGVQNNEPATLPAPGVPYDSDGHEVIPNPPNMAPGEVAPKPPAPEPTPPAPPIPTG